MRVHILHEARYSGNTESLLFPLHLHRRRLRHRGVTLRFFRRIDDPLFACDALLLSSRFFSDWWREAGGDRVLRFLADAREKGVARIVWYDIGDSTGVNKFLVLPLVDRYVKGQLLRDRNAYLRPYYGMRPVTDFYHRRFGIMDAVPDEAHLAILPQPADLSKLALGWNWGMANWGAWGELFGKIAWRIPGFPRMIPRRWYPPAVDRPIPISCRIGTSYGRATVAFPRLEIRRRLAGRIPMHRLPRRQYFHELTRSVAGLTPFGWGEVCYRDFELIIAGAAMVKQDMRHLETWPDIYQDGLAYLPIRWDLSDLEEKIAYIEKYPAEMVERARRAQEIYRSALATEAGWEDFCDRFIALVSS